jgi:hypothetical protein
LHCAFTGSNPVGSIADPTPIGSGTLAQLVQGDALIDRSRLSQFCS